MNCNQAQEAMAGSAADGNAEDPVLAAHLASCGPCRDRREAFAQLSRTLRALSAEPMPPGVEQRLRAAIRREAPRARPRHAAIWALAASILIAVAVETGTRMERTALDEVVADVTVATQQATTVQLAFNAGRQLDDVRFSLSIPPGFELDGRPGESLVRWNGTLDPGPNLLDVPIRALGTHDGILVASIESGGAAKTFKVRLKPGDPALQRGI